MAVILRGLRGYRRFPHAPAKESARLINAREHRECLLSGNFGTPVSVSSGPNLTRSRANADRVASPLLIRKGPFQYLKI